MANNFYRYEVKTPTTFVLLSDVGAFFLNLSFEAFLKFDFLKGIYSFSNQSTTSLKTLSQ